MLLKFFFFCSSMKVNEGLYTLVRFVSLFMFVLAVDREAAGKYSFSEPGPAKPVYTQTSFFQWITRGVKCQSKAEQRRIKTCKTNGKKIMTFYVLFTYRSKEKKVLPVRQRHLVAVDPTINMHEKNLQSYIGLTWSQGSARNYFIEKLKY